MRRLTIFGERLRHFRKKRGLSQLELSVSSGSTARHVSFIETGRSRPRKELVLRLCSALDLSLRESNVLLESAGLKTEYQECDLNDKRLESARMIVEGVLLNHNPFPAWSIGAGLRFLDSNQAAENIFPGLVGLDPFDVIDIFCAAIGKQEESERQASVRHIISALKSELFHYPHPDLPALLKHAKSYATDFNLEPEELDTPFVFGSLSLNGELARTVSTVMRFDKPTDVTVSEIRIELVFPADDKSDTLMRKFYASK